MEHTEQCLAGGQCNCAVELTRKRAEEKMKASLLEKSCITCQFSKSYASDMLNVWCKSCVQCSDYVPKQVDLKVPDTGNPEIDEPEFNDCTCEDRKEYLCGAYDEGKCLDNKTCVEVDFEENFLGDVYTNPL